MKCMTGCGLALLVLIAAVLPAGAGVLVRSNGSGADGDVSTEMSLTESAVRLDDGGGHTAIYRKDESLFRIINHKDKTYFEMTRDELEEMVTNLSGQMGQARKMMEEQLKNVPEEQRKMVEDMMKSRLPAGMSLDGPSGETEYEKLESGVEVGSWKTDRYEGRSDGEKVAEVWTATPAALGIAADDFAVLEELGELFANLSQALGDAFPGFRGAANYSDFDGVPVKQVRYSKGKVRSEHQVEEVRNKTFDPTLFDRPKGYEKTDPFKKR